MEAMYNVQPPKAKLSRPNSSIPYYNGELSYDMLGELIYLFSPQSGTVIDPYIGTMTTTIASLKTGRRCVTRISGKLDFWESEMIFSLNMILVPFESC